MIRSDALGELMKIIGWTIVAVALFTSLFFEPSGHWRLFFITLVYGVLGVISLYLVVHIIALAWRHGSEE